jgi:dihydrofolate synthase/folylpolyglutamate synthase
MNILGDGLGLIAFEKAGIIKPSTPVVIGEDGTDSTPVFKDVARKKNAPIFFADKSRHIVDWKWEKHDFIVEISGEHQTDHKFFKLDLPGIYQAKNLLTVLECCSQLHHLNWNLDDDSIRKGLSQAKKITGLHGRWEIIHHAPLVVLDVAHNEDGIRQLLQQVELIVHRQLHIVFGLVRDKEVGKIVSLLPKHAKYYFTRSAIPRAMPEDQLAAIANEFGFEGNAYAEVNEALRAALVQAHADDLILVCGSVFLVGEVNSNLH